MTLTPEQFNAFESLACDLGGKVYENYSGRSMFGKTCLGITVEELKNSLFRLGGEAASYEFSKELSNFRTDDMGCSYIIYFPKLQKEVAGE